MSKYMPVQKGVKYSPLARLPKAGVRVSIRYLIGTKDDVQHNCYLRFGDWYNAEDEKITGVLITHWWLIG